MKILHVVNSLDPGGMENGVVNLARSLEARGFVSHVACLERRGAFAERLPASSEVMVLGKGHGFSPAATWRLVREIARLRPDIVHSHNLGQLIYGGLATLGGWLCPLVQGEHSHLTDRERGPWRLRQRRWLYRGCRAVLTVSTAMREELLACGFPGSKIVAIANGVDTQRFAPGNKEAARRALGLPIESPHIGIVGRFGPYKRHTQLIEAFELIVPDFPTAHLVIAGGGGSEESAIRERAQSSPVHTRIHFLGFQPEPSTCYQALDLLTIPSVNEGLSNAALEAMACGVPVLARSGCGHEQIITHGVDGWIAAMDSPPELATHLAEILAAPSRLVDFERNARNKVSAQFSLESMISAYEHLYRTCVAR